MKSKYTVNRKLAPINKNAVLGNEHTGYVAMSGYGKSQALKQNPNIPPRGVRFIAWDPDEDHKAKHFDNMKLFERELLRGIRSGRGFRIAWSGSVDDDTFNYFCYLCWIFANGYKPTYVIMEELADVTNAGTAKDYVGTLFRRGRKYNLKIHWTTQRSQEATKTAYSQSGVKYIGYPDETCTPQNAAALGRIAGVSGDDLYALEPLQFYKRANKQTEKVVLTYKK